MADFRNDANSFANIPMLELLGIKLEMMKPGYALLSMPFDEKITQPYQIVHGGALFTLADSAIAAAIFPLSREGQHFLTVEMKINFLEPVAGGLIEARASVLRQGRIIPAEAELINQGRLVAKALATYIIVDDRKKG